LDLSTSEALILFSPVNQAELWAGARPTEYDSLGELFGALVCAPGDAEVGRRAGDYLRRYRKSHGVELGDALIAATAVAHRAMLWTRNRKQYPMKELSFFD
jgi:predicted nucleic acid-binding protein